MSDYQLKFTEKTPQDNRQETLNELIQFMRGMEGLTMSVVTLDVEQSENWDKEGKFDYQNFYGEQIVQKIMEVDTNAECIVIRNSEHLPVAMASSHSDKSTDTTTWQGIGVDKRLRTEIINMIGLDDYDLENPL